jgi:hypothetical protein
MVDCLQSRSLINQSNYSEFYITHWEQIKDELFLLVNDTFEKKKGLTPSQYKGFLLYYIKVGSGKIYETGDH